jgi:hypothetical protein
VLSIYVHVDVGTELRMLIIYIYCRPSSAQGKRDSDDSPDDDNDVDWSYHVDKKCK